MAKRRIPPKAVSKDAIVGELKGVLLLGVGVVGGSVLGSMLDKMLKVDPTDTRMDLKKFVRPLVLIGAGAVGSIKLGDENMKNIAKGVAMSGILSGVKVILRKDLLAGLEGFESLGAIDAYGEPVETFGDVYYEPEMHGLLALPAGENDMPMLGVEEYDPTLPKLEAMPLTYEESANQNYNIAAIEDVEYETVGDII